MISVIPLSIVSASSRLFKMATELTIYELALRSIGYTCARHLDPEDNEALIQKIQTTRGACFIDFSVPLISGQIDFKINLITWLKKEYARNLLSQFSYIRERTLPEQNIFYTTGTLEGKVLTDELFAEYSGQYPPSPFLTLVKDSLVNSLAGRDVEAGSEKSAIQWAIHTAFLLNYLLDALPKSEPPLALDFVRKPDDTLRPQDLIARNHFLTGLGAKLYETRGAEKSGSTEAAKVVSISQEDDEMSITTFDEKLKGFVPTPKNFKTLDKDKGSQLYLFLHFFAQVPRLMKQLKLMASIMRPLKKPMAYARLQLLVPNEDPTRVLQESDAYRVVSGPATTVVQAQGLDLNDNEVVATFPEALPDKARAKRNLDQLLQSSLNEPFILKNGKSYDTQQKLFDAVVALNLTWDQLSDWNDVLSA